MIESGHSVWLLSFSNRCRGQDELGSIIEIAQISRS
jgi:hypothetical protein